MSDATLFGFGAVVFMIGGWGLLMILLDLAQEWRLRESEPDEERHLRGDGSVRDVLRGTTAEP